MPLTFKPISQRKWTRGLQATFSIFAEPESILKRLSNMVYTRRGGLKVVDGSLIFTERNGVPQSADGPILDVVLYSPTPTNRYYVGIQVGPTIQLALVTGLTATPVALGGTLAIQRLSGTVTVTLQNGADITGNVQWPPLSKMIFLMGNIQFQGTTHFNTTIDTVQLLYQSQSGSDVVFTFVSGGSDTGIETGTWAPTVPLPAGTYTFDATASDASGGETPGTGSPASAVISGSNNAVLITWNPVASATGYNLYLTAPTSGRLNPSPASLISGVNPAISTPQFAYLGVVNTPGTAPPGANNTNAPGPCIFWKFDAPSYTVQIGTLPPAQVIALLPPPGGGSGTGIIPPGQNPAQTPNGGVIGQGSPLPQIIPFQGAEILALGNGTPPQYFADGSTLQLIPNTFTAIYPDWQSGVVANVGDNIIDSVSGGIFSCVQGGTTGSSRPTFNNTLHAGTADTAGTGDVVWQCIATNYQGQPLRGAAHAIVYAGYLFIANTFPTITSDQQDGPSCLRSSDLGNFKSWNPINVAMVNQDDGDQITGLAQFTIAELGISPTGNLVVFKTFTTYQITGVFGASDFDIQASKTDMGCIASRSIQFLSGFGQIARLTHLGFAMFDGTNDKVFSEEIRPYLFGDPNQPDIIAVDWSRIYFSKAAQSSNPPMYLCACPILPVLLTGISAARTGGSLGPFVTYYLKVTKLETRAGVLVETEISQEFTVTTSILLQGIGVTTPAAQTGVQYRVYFSQVSGAEDNYLQAASFNGTALNIAAGLPGIPSLGTGALTRIFAYDLVQKNWTIIDLPFPISALKQIRTLGTQTLTICGDWSDSALRRLFAGDTTWDGTPISWTMTGGEIFQQGGSGKIFFRRVVVRGSSVTYISVGIAANIQGKPGATKTAPQSQLGPQQWDARVDIMLDGENANITVSGQGQTTLDSVDWYVKAKPAGAPVSAQR